MAAERKNTSRENPSHKTRVYKKSGTGKTKSRTTGKRRTQKKKPKVALSTRGVMTLTTIIVALCVLLLAFSSIFQSPSKAESQKYIQSTSSAVSNSTQKSEQKPDSSINTKSGAVKSDKEQSKKKETKPSSQKTVENRSSVDTKKQTETVQTTASSSKKTVVNENAVNKQTEKTVSDKANNSKTESVNKAESVKESKKAPEKTESVKTNKASQDRGDVVDKSKLKPAVTPEKNSTYNIPDAKNGATIVIVIDDAGLNVANTKKYATLPFPITIAVLPKLSHSKDCAYVVRSNGKELILHQPMQSVNLKLNPGPGAITQDMNSYEIAAIVKENLKEIGPGVKGLNNHEGSLITSNVLKIGTVLDVCQEEGIYFLDSRTTAETQAPQAALERDMKIFEKAGPYLDNVISRDEMLKQIYASLDVANKKGIAIIIGHVDKSAAILPDLLNDMYPYLVKKGYRFATPSLLK